MPLETLKKRSDFLRVRGGARWGAKSFALEVRPRQPLPSSVKPDGDATQNGLAAKPDDSDIGVERPARFGFTVTKKLGNAVTRNRIKRRLREAVRSVAPEFAREGCDYVLIARHAALSQSFEQLTGDLKTAFQRTNASLDGKSEPRRNKPRGATSRKT